MAVLYTNNAASTLASSISNVGTSLSVASGQGALFPSLAGGGYFYATLTNSSGSIEIIKVTARTTDTMTIVRGQDGTSGLAWSAGDKFELRITRAMLDDLKTDAVSGYLLSSTAASTYQTQSGMSSYLTTASASSTYQTISGMSSYLTTASASSTYQTISGMSSYLTTSTAASTYQTQSGMSSYLTTSSASSTYLALAGGTLTGNLTFSGSNLRITGDFTSSTRMYVQTTTTNGNTFFAVLPNGTATNSQLQVFGNSDPANAPFGTMTINSGTLQIQSAATGTGTTLPFRLMMSTTEVLRVSTAANVLIGTSTDNGADKLQVNGTSNLNGVVNINGTGGSNTLNLWGASGVGIRLANTTSGSSGYITNTSNAITVAANGTGASHVWSVNGGTAATIDSSGNLGIATSSPLTKLHVAGAKALASGTYGASTQLIGTYIGESADGNLYAEIDMRRWTGVASNHGAGRISVDATANMIFFSDVPSSNTYATTELMRLNSTGLGIGTTLPSQKLDVRGSIYVQRDTNPTNAVAINITNQTTTSNNGARILFDAYNIGSSGLGIPSDSASLAFYTGGITNERMRIDASGNVGIGTTAPTTTLYVEGTVSARSGSTGIQIYGTGGSGEINSVGYNPLIFNVNSTERARIDTSGNLGLGVTPSTWDSSIKALQVKGISVAGQDAGSGAWILSNARNNGGTWYYQANGYAQQYEISANNGQHRWSIAPSGTAGNAITFTQAMTLHASGGLSLGNTTDPGATNLSVSGSLSGFKTATFASQPTIATTTGAITVNWTTAQNQKQTMPTGAITYTFTAPPGPCHLQLIIDNNGANNAVAITWPATVIWMGNTWSGNNNKKAVINFWYDGTNYFAMGANEV